MAITVLLADDSHVMRETIERHLKTEPDIHVLGQVKNFDEAVRMLEELAPDIVILDLRMTAAVDVQHQGIKQLCSCRTIVISATVDDTSQVLAKRLNADAFIDKMKLYDKLEPTIRDLASRG
jgi:DNA-binding NarL/FixJ family response regulator